MLPSSAAACLVMLAHASWMTRRYWWATLWAVVAVLVRSEFLCYTHKHARHVDRRRAGDGQLKHHRTTTTPYHTPPHHHNPITHKHSTPYDTTPQGLGWPFVALLFVPLALHVLAESVAAANGDVAAGTLRLSLLLGFSSFFSVGRKKGRRVPPNPIELNHHQTTTHDNRGPPRRHHGAHGGGACPAPRPGGGLLLLPAPRLPRAQVRAPHLCTRDSMRP